MDSVPVCIVVGAVLGFLTGLGIGGGSLLILWLTQVLTTPQQEAQGINLLFFLPSALLSCFFSFRQGRLRWRIALPAILSGATGAAISAWVATGIHADVLGKVFGFLLLAAGLWELFSPQNRKKQP